MTLPRTTIFALAFLVPLGQAGSQASAPPARPAQLTAELMSVTAAAQAGQQRALAALEQARVETAGTSLRTERFQGDPADSLYRLASELFGRGEYRSSAERFAEVRSRFPSTRYLCNSWYNEAFARYRLGLPDDLRAARRLLGEMSARCPAQNQDVPGLTLRVNTALSRTGDAEAIEAVRRAASSGSCDSEERSVRIVALNALAQSEPDSATPLFRALLSRRDPCSAPVRSQAMGIVARHNNAEAAALLSQSARTDPDLSNRRVAIRHLGSMPNDEALSTLEMLIHDADRTLQIEAATAIARMANCSMAAASAQARSAGGRGATAVRMASTADVARQACNARATSVLRSIIAQRSLPDAVRLAAIDAVGSGQAPSTVVRVSNPPPDMYAPARPAGSTPAGIAPTPVVTAPPSPPAGVSPPTVAAVAPGIVLEPRHPTQGQQPPGRQGTQGQQLQGGRGQLVLSGAVEAEWVASRARLALGPGMVVDPELRQALTTVAADPTESSELRSAALLKVRGVASLAELAQIYESAGSRVLRLSVVSALGSRSESEATDRLIDIAKISTDPEVRNAAIRKLGEPARRDNPKVQRALAEILSCCGW